MKFYRRSTWLATSVLVLTIAVVCAPLAYSALHLAKALRLGLEEPELLSSAVFNTVAFAFPSAIMQTAVGFLGALFVSAMLKGRTRWGARATLLLDMVIVLPYLLPTVAWFWFSTDQGISTGRLLEFFGARDSAVSEKIAEMLDAQVVAVAHLGPFSYLVLRLFFDRIRTEQIDHVARSIGGRMKALVVLGGRPLLGLLLGIFALRLLITANKYDLPYLASKGYEGLRTESWLFTLPLWLDHVNGLDHGLAISAALSLALFLAFGLAVGCGFVLRQRMAGPELSRRLGNSAGALLSRVRSLPRAVLGFSAGSVFIGMVGSSLFVVFSLLSHSAVGSFWKLMDVPSFRDSLWFSFVAILALGLVAVVLIPICRLVHLLSDGWGVAVNFQLVGLFLLLPPVLVAIAWRPATFLPRPLIYGILLFTTAFPFLYLQLATAWPHSVASALATMLRSKPGLSLVLQHLRGGQLRDFAVASYLIAYVVVVNEIVCAEMLLPTGSRPVNHTLVRLKSMFDSNENVQATAPLVVVLLGASILVPLYFVTRPKTTLV